MSLNLFSTLPPSVPLLVKRLIRPPKIKMYLRFPISPKKHYGLVGFGSRSGINVSPVSGHSLSEQSPSVSPACPGARAGDKAPGAAFTLYEALLDLLSLCFGPVPGCVESMLITKKKK